MQASHDCHNGPRGMQRGMIDRASGYVDRDEDLQLEEEEDQDEQEEGHETLGEDMFTYVMKRCQMNRSFAYSTLLGVLW